jgi:hypothetical protein
MSCYQDAVLGENYQEEFEVYHNENTVTQSKKFSIYLECG